MEAVRYKLLSRLQCCHHVGEKGFLVPEHLQLHQVVAVEELAREMAGANGRLGIVAAGGVGQDRVALRRQHVQDIGLRGRLTQIGAAYGHRDDLGPARLDGAACLVHVSVLAGTDQKPRAELAAGDGEGICCGCLCGHGRYCFRSAD